MKLSTNYLKYLKNTFEWPAATAADPEWELFPFFLVLFPSMHSFLCLCLFRSFSLGFFRSGFLVTVEPALHCFCDFYITSNENHTNSCPKHRIG